MSIENHDLDQDQIANPADYCDEPTQEDIDAANDEQFDADGWSESLQMFDYEYYENMSEVEDSFMGDCYSEEW